MMLENIKNHSPKFKDSMIFAAWILGILVLGALLWYFTQNFRDNRMVRTVNGVLINNNDNRRLISRLEIDSESIRKPFQQSQRFSLLNSTSTALIITMYDDTIPLVCAVFINNDGKVSEFVPLDNHSAQVFSRMEKTKLDTYQTQIEAYEKLIRSGE
jgi:hypothetical protein